MSKVAKLICVAVNNPKSTSSNNNKYYNMVENNDGTFTATWGRVGVTSDSKVYPMSKWESTIRSKVKKGYKDITELCVVDEHTKQFVDISDSAIAKLISDLQNYANQLINKTYLIGADAVTLKQIEEAQLIINDLVSIMNTGFGSSSGNNKILTSLNKTLLKLYTTIPRKMKNVNDHLFVDWKEDRIGSLINEEQDNLDAMESQVKTHLAQQSSNIESTTILDVLGIEVEHIIEKEKKAILDMMGDSKSKFKTAYRILKKDTNTSFDIWVASSKNKDREMLFHGSRNSNWFFILQNGLLIRPSNAVYTGSMFGDALYFANEAKKSLGYTSLDGSYWARGSDHKAFMGIYEVHVGNKKIIKTRSYEHGSLNYEKIRKEGFDSVHALGKKNGGNSLFNDEITVYTTAQANIRYLIELG